MTHHDQVAPAPASEEPVVRTFVRASGPNTDDRHDDGKAPTHDALAEITPIDEGQESPALHVHDVEE